jgi:hypothetical protein
MRARRGTRTPPTEYRSADPRARVLCRRTSEAECARFGQSVRVKLVMPVVVLVLASCSDGATSNGPDGALDGPVMRYPQPASNDEGMAAEVRGVLQLEGSCLYVFLDDVGERYPVLWPAGTTWDDKRAAVVPPEGGPIPIGSGVYGGGGYLMVEDIERLAGMEAADRAATCVDNQYGEIAVVNNTDTAIALAAK